MKKNELTQKDFFVRLLHQKKVFGGKTFLPIFFVVGGKKNNQI